MKKVGIITICDNNNYGNRLQNYAVQEFLKKQNCNPITLKNYVNTNKENNIVSETLRKIKNFLRRSKEQNKYNKCRYKEFQNFNKQYINTSKKPITYCNSSKIEKKFDLFMVGSDQVWNPNFARLSYIDLLKFSPKEKNIAFSASFGVSKLTEEQIETCKGTFEQFKAISVREDAGKQIIQEIAPQSEVEVLIDPTMLLKREEWEKIIKKPEQLNCQKYILNYFLGGLTEQYKSEIERIAKENDCKIINILDKNDPFNTCGPSEFLYLEKNAFLVCTDSFHSTIFSIIFHRPFIVFKRADTDKIVEMNSRLETLLTKLKLTNQNYREKIEESQLEINFLKTDELIEEEAKKAEYFIEKAIK